MTGDEETAIGSYQCVSSGRQGQFKVEEFTVADFFPTGATRFAMDVDIFFYLNADRMQGINCFYHTDVRNALLGVRLRLS